MMKKLLLLLCLIGSVQATDLATLRPKGNAIVPDDAPIQPPQAFVDCSVYEVIAAINLDDVIDWSGRHITSIDASAGGLIDKIDHLCSRVDAIKLNLSNNAITNTAEIFALLVSNGNSGGEIDLAGGTNTALPLPVFILDWNTIDITAGDLGECSDTRVAIIDYAAGDLADVTVVNLSDTAFPMFTIGRDDTPTKQQIITKLAAVSGGKITDLGGLIMQIALPDRVMMPIDFTDFSAGSHYTVGNGDPETLRLSRFWTVTTP